MTDLSGKRLNVEFQAYGGRSGEFVKTLTGPPDSIFKGGGERLFVTDHLGRVILDLTRERAKDVVPNLGFVSKRQPTDAERQVLSRFFP